MKTYQCRILVFFLLTIVFQLLCQQKYSLYGAEDTPVFSPAVMIRGNERIDAFTRGADNSLWHEWWDDGIGWGSGESLGGNLASAPVVITRGNERMDVFARGADNTLWHKWWDEGIGWGSGESLGGNLASAPVVITRGNERMDVFARGADNTLWHKWWDEGIGWGSGESLGGNLASAPVVITRGNERMDVFARGADNTLWHKWWDEGIGWGSGESLGGNLASAPVVITRGNERMDVFARGADNTLWHKWWDEGIGWGSGESLGGNLASAPVVITRGNERMDVFARGADNTLWHKWWDEGIGWGSGESLGGNLASAPVVITRGNERMDVFANDPCNFLSHQAWTGGVGWGAWKATLVNIIPLFLSGESNQDSEPFLSVHPTNRQLMAASAFTPNPAGPSASTAPIFISQDCGSKWDLNAIIPSMSMTADITHAFDAGNGSLYAGILKRPGFPLNELVTTDFVSPTLMTTQSSREEQDQPFIQATTVGSNTRLYVGVNDFTVTNGRTATIDLSLDSGATWSSVRIEPRTTSGQNGSIRSTYDGS